MTVRVLTMTSLFPNGEMPRHGIFVRERLRHLVETQPVEADVVAPVAWFPARGRRWGHYGRLARIPATETMDGIEVRHPRFLTLPRVGNAFNPLSMAMAVRRCLERQRLADFDLIDAHYAFPDGVAAILLGGWLGKPVVVTVRGSDVNTLPDERAAGWWLRRTLWRCDEVIAVSQSLAERTTALEPRLAGRVSVLRNGVDRRRFTITAGRSERPEAGPALLSVGNLIPLKGHDLVIRALERLPGSTLTIVGEGPQRASLARLAEELGLGSRVRFTGNVDQAELSGLYNASDVTVLASESEGLPNVVLESLACGTPVVATNVGGVGEVLRHPDAGRMTDDRSAPALAAAVNAVLDRRPAPERVREQAAPFDWDATSAGVYRVFARVAGSRRLHCAQNGGAAT